MLQNDQLFRPSTWVWATEVWVPIALSAAGFVALVLLRTTPAGLIISGIVLLLLIASVLKRSALPMWRYRLEASPDFLSGRTEHGEFKVFWRDVLAAQKIDFARRPWLQLATREHAVSVPLKWIDGEAL